jgi:hypothetical protein
MMVWLFPRLAEKPQQGSVPWEERSDSIQPHRMPACERTGPPEETRAPAPAELDEAHPATPLFP